MNNKRVSRAGYIINRLITLCPECGGHDIAYLVDDARVQCMKCEASPGHPALGREPLVAIDDWNNWVTGKFMPRAE